MIYLLENFENFLDESVEKWQITTQEYKIINNLIEKHKQQEQEPDDSEETNKWIDYEKDMEKECWCETRKSECEKKWQECYFMFIDWYLTCSKCWFMPNDLLDDLCEHDFK